MFKTLRTLMRAQAAEAEERLELAQGPAILAQHLRDAEADLRRARLALAELTAARREEARREATARDEIARREAEAREAVAAGEDTLADAVAERILALEEQAERAATSAADLDRRTEALRQNIAAAEVRLQRVAVALRTARAGRMARGAGISLGTAGAAAMPALAEAEAMAEKLGAEGQRADDRLEALAGNPLAAPPGPTSDLDARLADAGVGDTRAKRRAAVLARLRGGAANDGNLPGATPTDTTPADTTPADTTPADTTPTDAPKTDAPKTDAPKT
ncbi:MAG: PspA/IM30 family protein [Pseudomonadota bacterium]